MIIKNTITLLLFLILNITSLFAEQEKLNIVNIKSFALDSTSQDSIKNKSIIVKRVGCVRISLYHIYYDFNQSSIRKDAEEDLMKLYQILQDNPNCILEIGAHTDARGSNTYNDKLSLKRAKAVITWLLNKGISEDRLVYFGYGETNLSNECENEVPCKEEEHQQNRRIEFRIIDTIDGVTFGTILHSISRKN